MTCAPDAFTSGDGLRVLGPGRDVVGSLGHRPHLTGARPRGLSPCRAVTRSWPARRSRVSASACRTITSEPPTASGASTSADPVLRTRPLAAGQQAAALAEPRGAGPLRGGGQRRLSRQPRQAGVVRARPAAAPPPRRRPAAAPPPRSRRRPRAPRRPVRSRRGRVEDVVVEGATGVRVVRQRERHFRLAVAGQRQARGQASQQHRDGDPVGGQPDQGGVADAQAQLVAEQMMSLGHPVGQRLARQLRSLPASLVVVGDERARGVGCDQLGEPGFGSQGRHGQLMHVRVERLRRSTSRTTSRSRRREPRPTRTAPPRTRPRTSRRPSL